MIKRESLQEKLAIAAMAGMLVLLLAVSCVAQTPLDMSKPENCTNCSANASSSPGLDYAAQETVLSNASVGQDLDEFELLGPSGIKNSGKLTYRWRDESSCTFYCLEVKDDLNEVVLKQCYDALDVLSDMKGYYVTPSASLDPGDYTWRILCSNCDGYIESDPMEFTVCTSSSFPGRATLVSPKDNIGGSNPTFVWMPVPGSTQYRLKVARSDLQNEPIFEAVYDAEEVFSETDKVCSIKPDPEQLDLYPDAYYRWWIQAINCRGDGPWSYYKSFRYLFRSPSKSTPLSPRGLTSSGIPTFTWTASPLATEYHLQVINYQDEEDIIVAEMDFRADKVTKGSRCSGTLGPLPDDDPVYYWRVQANNDASEFDPDAPTWSSWRYFETICAYKPGTDAKKARRGYEAACRGRPTPASSSHLIIRAKHLLDFG
jgi:hypothetical protein